MQDLPLLQFTSSLFSHNFSKNTYLIGVQHLAFTTLEMIKVLIKKGLSGSNIFLLGKCYSANPLVVKELKKMGVHVSDYSFAFDSHVPYDRMFKENIEKFLRETLMVLPRDANSNIMLLDDGAALLRLSQDIFPKNSNIIGIEQTSSGFHLAQKISSNLPIINVARSQVKLNQETKFIARMVARKVLEYTQTVQSNISNVLIIGSGYIGRAVTNLLKKKYSVEIYDSRKSLKAVEEEELSILLKRADVIIGCTGFNSLLPSDHKYLKKNAILISASSSDREFNAVEFRKQISSYYDCHKSIKINGVLLVNSGFPINFDENYLDSYEFQLTRSLILAAIFQAVSFVGKKKNGFIPLWHQKEIKKKYFELHENKKLLTMLRNRAEFDNRDVSNVRGKQRRLQKAS